MKYLERTMGIVGLLTLVSCTDSDGPSDPQETAKQVQEVGGGVATYDTRRPSRTTGEVADRALTLAKILDDTLEASHERVQSALDSLPADGPNNSGRGWFVHPIASRPNLAIAYFVTQDDLRVADTSLTRDYDSPASVDEDQARKLFHGAFDALASAGVVDRNNYDLTREHVGYTKHGSGSEINGVTTETPPQISEYHFRVRRLLDNIEFANELVKISVHVTGRISTIRVVGAEVGPRVGRVSARTMSDSALRSRFSSDYPNGFAEWDQLLYTLSGDEQSGVIEPKYVFSFSSVYISDGVPVVSRRQEVRYSVTNADAEPEIWPVPRPNATGDDASPQGR